MSKNRNVIAEMFSLMRDRWWLIPALVVLLAGAILIILGQSSALSPFIYALF